MQLETLQPTLERAATTKKALRNKAFFSFLERKIIAFLKSTKRY